MRNYEGKLQRFLVTLHNGYSQILYEYNMGMAIEAADRVADDYNSPVVSLDEYK